MWTSAKEGIIMRNVIEKVTLDEMLRGRPTMLVAITARSA
jgi:hypothetical protein